MSRAPAASPIRLIVSLALITLALSLSLIGFVRLIRVLESGGYGTPAVRGALTFMGAGGGVLAAGIALLIWDIARRHGRK